MHFRLLTYNIHKGIGGIDRKYDLGRIVETIQHYEPDFALLQEVDDGVPRSRRHVQAELLAEATGLLHVSFGRTVALKTGCYGNTVLSRYPLYDTVEVDLTVRPKKRRGAIVARLHVPVGPHTKAVTLVTLHLGLSGIERQWQLRRLLRAECLSKLRKRAPLVIAGDLNDVWGTLGRRVLAPAGFNAAGVAIPTYPAAMPLRPLDRVFYRGDLRAEHLYAGRTDVARQASDHLPLVAEFEFTRK
jgi:endonuclease/exonuclease/phosphatase family metal-dependent hydrolase